MAFRLPYWEEGRTALWHPAFPHLGIPEADCWAEISELFAWIEAGSLIEAHNAWYERGIWTNIMVPKYGCPEIPHKSWRCSAAKAAAHALPRALEKAADAMHLPITKDLEGSKVMKKCMKPREPIKRDITAWNRQHAPCPVCLGVSKVQEFKKDGSPKSKLSKCKDCAGRGHVMDTSAVPELPRLYHESRELFEVLWAYCRQDVLSEQCLSEALPDLSELETEVYLLDQRINERGYRLDRSAVRAARKLIRQEVKLLSTELKELTGGAVEKATQRTRMLEWFITQDLHLYDTKKETIAEALQMDDTYRAMPEGELAPWVKILSPTARRGLELMQMLGKSSTAKYKAMKDSICPDARVHGGLLYHGATTGRWSGAGVQPHNFPKGDPHFQNQVALWKLLKTLDRDRILTDAPLNGKGKKPYTSVMGALSQALRGAIVPAVGSQLYVADFASIEARVLLWIADDQEALDIFRTGGDMYCYMASDIYGYPCNKSDHPKERGVGKEAVLGLGYQMGWAKFQARCLLAGVVITCALAGIIITEEFAQQVVDTYRAKFWRVKQLWSDQNEAAIRAVHSKGRVNCGYVSWVYELTPSGFPVLYCELPSGRRLAYPEPKIKLRKTPWGSDQRVLTFMGVNSHTHQWERLTTYGGMIVENIVQAISRDLMAEGMLRAEATGIYLITLTVHDELVSEAEVGTGSVKEFEDLMSALPDWGEGCPVTAEGWVGPRYRK